jgi:N-acetyl-anhydromuramyl-L-alanine amidase AmpD
LHIILLGPPTVLSAQKKGEKPPILHRDEWGAKPPVGEGKKHKIEFITIHHTAVKQRIDLSLEAKLKNLQAFSQRDDKLASGKAKPAWFDIPYHYYISVDGRIGEGRPIEFAGDTNTEYDPAGHALIVLEGSFGSEEPTASQIDSLKKMVAWLSKTYKIKGEKIGGHRDYAETGCPGANLEKLLPELRKLVD